MSDQTLVACPHCQKRYKLHVAETKVVKCSQCQNKFRVHPPQVAVAQLAAAEPELVASSFAPATGRPGNASHLTSRRGASAKKTEEPSGMSGGAKLLIAALAAGFLFLLIGVGVLIMLYKGMERQVVNAIDGPVAVPSEIRQAPLAPEFGATVPPSVPRGGFGPTPVDSPFEVREISARSFDKGTAEREGVSRDTRNSNSKTSQSAAEVAYDFVEGRQYTFDFDFETELGKQKVLKMNGSNYVTKLPRGDLPIRIEEFGVSGGKRTGGQKQVLDSRAYTMSETKNQADPYSMSSPKHQDFEGVVELDGAGQPNPIKRRLKANLLPCVSIPMSRIGIEPLPPEGETSWTVENEIITVNLTNESEPGRFPGDRFGGFPGYMPSPYGYPGASQRNVPDASVCTLKRVESFEIESQNDSQVRVKKTLKVVPDDKNDSDAPQLSLEASGYYIFDKEKKCIVKSELTGTADIKSDNVSVKIPIRFSTSLRSIKTKEELAADRVKREADRKKKNEELAKKRKEVAASTGTAEAGSAGSESSTEPKRFKATESEEGRVPNQMVAVFEDLGWGVDSLAFSPKGILYAGKMDRSVLVFNFKKRKKIDEKTKLEDLGQVKVSVVSPNGKYLLTGGYSGRIEVWELKNDGTLKEGESFAGHSKEIQTIAISADSKLAVSGGSDKRARVWDIESCKEIAAYDGFERSVMASYIAADNSYALVSDGCNLMKIDLATNEMVSNPKVLKSYAHAAAFSPDGKKLAISEGYNVHLIDTTSFVEEAVLEGPRNIHYGLAFDKAGKYLFAGGRHITQWDWEKGESVNEYHLSDHATIRSIAITDDGEHLASIGSSAGQDLKVFKIRNGPEED